MSKTMLKVANAVGAIKADRQAIVAEFQPPRNKHKMPNCQKLVLAVNTMLGN